MALATPVNEARHYRSSSLHRITAPDMHVAQELLDDAAATLAPDDQTQRKAFEALMPSMFVLRNKGVSWAQLTALLSKAGFHLQQSTVRTYYSEMLVRKLDVCQERMTQQIALLKSIKKETEGVELANISNRVSTVMAQTREATAPRMRELLGDPGYTPRVPVLKTAAVAGTNTAAAPSAPPARRTGVADRKQAPSVTVATRPPQNPATKTVRQTATKQAQGHSRAPIPQVEESRPSVPVLRHPATENTASPDLPTENADTSVQSLQCMKLQPGVTPLRPREGVPSTVYTEGMLEHPAIQGLKLSLAERVYGALLEYKDMDTGEVHIETADQKRFRVLWRPPIPKTQTSTANSFIKTDMSLFGASGRDPQ